MTDVMTDGSSNKVTIEDAGPCRKKIVIEIPADVVTAKLTESLDTMMHEAPIPGFRKGRAPRRLVEKRFGGALRDETKRQLMSSAYAEAVEQNSLKVLGEPSSETFATAEVEEGKALSFDVEVEVVPEFDLPSLEGIKVLKPAADVPDDLVNTEIEKLCINEGSLEEREKAEPGDYLTGRGTMTGDVNGDEKTFHDIEGAVVRLPEKDSDGKGMILGVMVDDFAKQLGTPKPGETATIKVKGPENHEVEDIRGTDLTVTFAVERVDTIIPAPLTDVVAKFGLESEDQLREGMVARLQQRAETQQKTVMRQQIMKHLLENTEFELPQHLTASQAARNFERRRMELMYRGADPQQIEEHIAELRAASATDAVRELKMLFILAKAGEDLGVQIEEAEVNAMISQMALEQGERPEKLRQELIQSNRVQALVQQIREHKTTDAILEKAELEEVGVDEFNERMKAEADGAKPAAKKKTTKKKASTKKADD